MKGGTYFGSWFEGLCHSREEGAVGGVTSQDTEVMAAEAVFFPAF